MAEKAYTINIDERNKMLPLVSRRTKNMKRTRVITRPTKFVVRLRGPVPGESRLSSQTVAFTTGLQ
jgi:hypothetical protein